MSMFTHHNSYNPCPLCGGVTDCRLNGLTNLQHCRRADKQSPPAGWRYVHDDSIGFGMFAADLDDSGQRDADGRGGMSPHTHAEITEARRLKAEQRAAGKEAAATASRFDEIRSRLRPMDEPERDAIASHLCLPLGVFSLLDVQICPDDGYGRMAWAFPERDAAGMVIGITLRYADNSKRNHGRRGLYIPSQRSNDSPSSPIFLVEGASNTLAMISMGLNVIGRPNDRAGADHLAELLRGIGRPLIVVGDNDKNGAGQAGAESVSQKLAIALGRPVFSAVTPVVNDSRELIKVNAAAIRAGDLTLAAVGEAYTMQLVAAAVPFGQSDTAPSPATVSAVGTAPALAIPFRAIDCPPPPDPTPTTTRPRCPTPKGVILTNRDAGLSRVQWFDCKRLGCPYCDGVKRQQYQATVQTHLETLARQHMPTADSPTPTVSMFWVDSRHWDTVSRSLRGDPDSPSRYFRLNCDGLLLVVSADAPPKSAHVTQAETISTEEASRRLCSAIMRIPKLREKAFSTSRAWKLVGNDKRKAWPDWKRIGKVTATQTAVWEILEHHAIDFQPITSRGMFWSWQAWQWTDSQARGKRQQIIDDIAAGEVLPTDAQIDSSFGGAASDEGAGDLVGAGCQPGDDGTFW